MKLIELRDEWCAWIYDGTNVYVRHLLFLREYEGDWQFVTVDRLAYFELISDFDGLLLVRNVTKYGEPTEIELARYKKNIYQN